MADEILNAGAFGGAEETDFAGGTLPFEVRLPDSDWNKPEYHPTGETQRGLGTLTDRLNCVTQANHNDIELQINQMMAAKTLPIGHAEWLSENGYFDAAGKLNVSEKYNAILNKTAQYKGNWLYTVANDTRKNGLIPQTMLPEKADYESWDQYYKEDQVTQEMLDMGKEFLKWFNVSYEWVNDKSVENLVKQLQHVPLQVVFSNHSVVEIKSKADLMDYYDSYNPWVKEKAQSEIKWVFKLIVDPIVSLPEEVKIIKDKDSKAVGVWVAAKNEAELISMAEEAGFPIPRKADGTLDWDKFIQGELTLNN